MIIANPIYDVVFKYMLEDNKVAKLFLSAIIGEEIEELDFAPQERSVKVQRGKDNKAPLTVVRYDFSAKIKTDIGYKTVIIELQKAKLQSDLMRFRRYLGVQLQSLDSTYRIKKQAKPRQIYCIYFLDYGADLPKRPVLKVDYKVEDTHTGDIFPAAGEFVEGLHHRSWIVQIRELKQKRRNELEQILSIFDQDNKTDNIHNLAIDEENYPEKYREIIRRLQKIVADKKTIGAMELEDEVVNEIKDKERQIDEVKKENKEIKAKHVAEIAEKDAALSQKDAELEKERKEKAQKDQEIEELKKQLSQIKSK